jgi:putative phosphoesterase
LGQNDVCFTHGEHDPGRDHRRKRVGSIALIGVLSDTHGLLRPEALEALRGAEAIVHAGDVGDPSILEALRRIAPVTAVRGNVDRGVLADLPASAVLDAGGGSIYVLHDLSDLDLNPRVAGFGVVVSGHTHAPVARESDGVLYLNPGSAGPRRFHLPVSVAMLRVEDGAARAEIIELPIR